MLLQVSEMYSYHRNNIATLWDMQDLPTADFFSLSLSISPYMVQKESDEGFD